MPPIGLISADEQSYLVMYPLKASSTFAEPNTSNPGGEKNNLKTFSHVQKYRVVYHLPPRRSRVQRFNCANK